MSNRLFNITMLVALFLFIVNFCSACVLFVDYEDSGPFEIGYHTISKQGFVGAYTWDGTEEGKTIVIPDTYKGADIVALGGYFGRGVPRMFRATVDIAHLYPEADDCWGSYITEDFLVDENRIKEIKYTDFTVKIGKNLKEFKRCRFNSCQGVRYGNYEDEDWTESFWIPRYYFICDENNTAFYATDGVLYDKETGKPIPDILYWDFTLIP